MNKKIVIISSSNREKSSSFLLAQEVEKGAIKSQNETTFINLKDLNINFCKGCLACQKKGKCIISDDVNKYLDVISNSDIIVMASPIYYYSICGQLKTFLDRLNGLYIRENRFKEIYLVLTAADDEEKAMDVAVDTVNGWASCFENVIVKKALRAVKVNSEEDLTKTLLDEAFKMGKDL